MKKTHIAEIISSIHLENMQGTSLNSLEQSFHSTISWNSIYLDYAFNNIRLEHI